jgi:hypothetical protein
MAGTRKAYGMVGGSRVPATNISGISPRRGAAATEPRH